MFGKLIHSITFVLCVAAVNSWAIEPKAAPINPDFIKWQSGEVIGNTEVDGHATGLIPSTMIPEVHQAGIGDTTEYPVHFDLSDPNGDKNRADSLMTPIKDQGSCGVCWAFAAYGAYEGQLATSESTIYDFSEDHLKHTNGSTWSNNNPCSGGNIDMVMAYLTRGSGPISEADDPYDASAGSEYCTDCNRVRYVDNIIIVPARNRDAKTDIDYLKEVLYTQQRPIYTSMQVGSGTAGEVGVSVWESATKSYYCGGEGCESTNHAVVIVGWDDAYVAQGQTGAFIVRNSWGSGWGESGYFYVPYNDDSFAFGANAYFDDQPESELDFDTVLDLEPLSPMSSGGYGYESRGSVYGANMFDITEDSQVKAVSFMARISNTDYEITLYNAVTNDSGNYTFSNQIGSTQSGTDLSRGWHTIKLDTPVDVTSGSKLIVSIKFTSDSYQLPFTWNSTNYTDDADMNSEESFYSFNGTSWTDFFTLYPDEGNIQIRALIKQNSTGGDEQPVVTEAQYKSSALTAPNGGEVWVHGQDAEVSWNTGDMTGSTVDIYMYNYGHDIDRSNVTASVNEKNWYKIANAVTNNGSYTLRPDNFGGGNDKVIMIVSSNGDWDISDNSFVVTHLNLLPENYVGDGLQSFNDGGLWSNGTTETLQWSSTMLMGDNVSIYLLRSTWQIDALLANPASPDMIYYMQGAWWENLTDTSNNGQADVTLNTEHQGKSVLLIVSSDGKWDITDSALTINPLPLVQQKYTTNFLTSPNGGENWKTGVPETVTWDTSIAAGTVKIYQIYNGWDAVDHLNDADFADYLKTQDMKFLGEADASAGVFNVDMDNFYDQGEYMILILSGNEVWDVSDGVFYGNASLQEYYLVPESISPARIVLRWEQMSWGIPPTTFELIRSDGISVTLDGNVHSYVDTNVVPETEYSYTLRANKEGETSTEVSVNYLYTGTMNAPTEFCATYAAPGEVTLVWKDNSNIETQYVMMKWDMDTPSEDPVTFELPANTETFTDTDVVAGGRYLYSLRAKKSDTVYSWESRRYVDVMDFASPSSFSAVVSGTTVDLSWNVPTGIDGVQLGRNNPDGTTTWLGVFDTATTTFSDTTVENGKHYMYFIFSTNGEDQSSCVGTVVGIGEVIPPAPQAANPAFTNVTQNAITFNWQFTGDESSITGFKIYRGDILIATITDTTARSYTDTGLEAGTDYTYTVKVTNDVPE